MKTLKSFSLIFFALILQFPCSADEIPDSLCSAFEIYIAKNKISYDSQVDYNSINLNTVELSDTPFLTFSEMESYDTVNHIINLKIPEIGRAHV